MESNRFCLGEKDDKSIRLDPKFKGDGSFITEAGEIISYSEFTEEEENKRRKLEATHIRETQISEMGRDRRKSRKRDGNRRTFGIKMPHFDNKAYYDESSCVTKLTKEDLMLEHIEKLVVKNRGKYLPAIRQNLADLATEFVEFTDQNKNKVFRTQITQGVLLIFTTGPYTLIEAADIFDDAINEFNPELNYRVKNKMSAFTSIGSRIIKSDSWFSDFLKVTTENGDGKGLPVSKRIFQFHPSLMILAATIPDTIRRGWFKSLPKEDEPYTLETLIKDIPTIIEQNKGFIKIVNHPKKERTDSMGMTTERISRKIANDSNMYAHLRDGKDRYKQYSDMKQWELIIILLVSSSTIFDTATGWAKWGNEFIKDYFNVSAKIKKVTGMMISGIRRTKLVNSELAISKLYCNPGKSTLHPLFGLIPDARSITLDNLWIMADQIKIDQGWSILNEECAKNEYMDRHVHPENYKDEQVAEESADKPLGDIEKTDTVTLPEDGFLEGLEIEDVLDEEGTAKPDAMMKLANAVSKIADNGVEVNFNIGFGRPQKKEDESTIDMLQLMNHTNDGLNIVLERMGLLMESVTELIMELKK